MKKVLLGICLSSLCAFSLTVGEVPKEVVLEKENGGRVDGTAWSSTMLKGKVHVLFYVDPDERDTNNAFSEALKAKKYDLNHFASVAVINLAATWLPNFVLEKKLKAKQEQYPNAIYVKDKSKVLVKEWELKDDSSDILVFSKKGELIYSYAGELDSSEIDKVLKLIDENLL